MLETKVVPILTVDENFVSIFKTLEFPRQAFSGMWISERQNALNFRYRSSVSNYQSDWHVAGDPTLIIVQQGQLKIETRSLESLVISSGECFIAADYLPNGMELNDKHGHRASVPSSQALEAIHIKLSDNSHAFSQHILISV